MARLQEVVPALEKSLARNAGEYSLSKKAPFRKPWRKEQLISKKIFRTSRLSAKASFEYVSAGCLFGDQSELDGFH